MTHEERLRELEWALDEWFRRNKDPAYGADEAKAFFRWLNEVLVTPDRPRTRQPSKKDFTQMGNRGKVQTALRQSDAAHPTVVCVTQNQEAPSANSGLFVSGTPPPPKAAT